MTNEQRRKPGALIYDDKGSMMVNEQIMDSYNSGSINKKGLLGDLFQTTGLDDDDEGAMLANAQIMNSYSSGSINKLGLHGDLFGSKGTKKHQ